MDSISGNAINDNYKDLYSMKSVFQESGVEVKVPQGKLSWADFKLNSDGMVPVVTQDYKTSEVLMAEKGISWEEITKELANRE